MTQEGLSSDPDLNKFYRTLIALQATALDYVSGGEGDEGKIARAVEATGYLDGAKQNMVRAGCSNCSEDEVCCSNGSCAPPGCCDIPMAAALSEQRS